MPRELWLNLPVADLERAREFYARIGFDASPAEGRDDMVGLRVGATHVMLVTREAFAGFAQAPASDPAAGAEVLLSVGAATREEVDELAARAEAAGGTVFGRPGGNEGMYGAGFADPDGHRWNVLWTEAWGAG